MFRSRFSQCESVVSVSSMVSCPLPSTKCSKTNSTYTELASRSDRISLRYQIVRRGLPWQGDCTLLSGPTKPGFTGGTSGDVVPRHPLWRAHADQEPGHHYCGRDHTGAGHWRQHGNLQHREWHAAAAAAG